jgi:hypothetical protein
LETFILFRPLERANPYHWTDQPPHLRTETEPVSEMLCSLEYRTVDKVQKLINSGCHIPQSEACGIYRYMYVGLAEHQLSEDGGRNLSNAPRM